jgi:hypothetical protein
MSSWAQFMHGRVSPSIRSPSFLNDPEHWRQRAEETRKVAQMMIDPQSKAVMLGIATTALPSELRAERQNSRRTTGHNNET